MRASKPSNAKRASLFAAVLLVCAALLSAPALRSEAQSVSPVLVSEAGSTRAVALESVTRLREPFSPTSPVQFGADARTRVMLFAMNLHLAADEDASVVTADAEDAAHHVYPLAVEYVGAVPGQEWMSSVVVRLNDDLGDVGDVLVRVSYRGASSNRVRVGVGHVGGGPPDDANSIPTPAPAAVAPTPSTNPTPPGHPNRTGVAHRNPQARPSPP